MKSTLKLLFLSIIFIQLFDSCTFYSPALVNVPRYDDSVMNVNVSTSIGTTADLNVSLNPTNHLSVIANGSYAGVISNEDDPFDSYQENEFKYHKYQVEAGVGYYFTHLDKYQYNIHVGYGMGRMANFFDESFSSEDAFASKMHNVFIQSSFAFEFIPDFLDAYVAAKVNFLTYYDFEAKLGNQSTPIIGRDAILFSNVGQRRYDVGQFALGLSQNLELVEIKAQAQFAFSNGNISDRFNVRPLGFSLGVNLNIDRMFK